ncbi:MAG: PAS domain-containing protein [Rhizomicrobium sp.]|nr:PAS domain-containing protein [Rhizomicrobium sp.]
MATSPTEEMPFQFDELFFSRTDTAGIIRSGNSVFQRVSGFDWDELIGKPHKVVRHPDMPRAVFYTLWDFIKRGEPVGAYVKNRTKDGRHYWVFAVVTPIDGGYLSVRLKPSSELFGVIQQEYEALRAKELAQDLSAAESARLIYARLKELGYGSYQAFMADAISCELLARDVQLARMSDRRIPVFKDVLGYSQGLLGQAATVAASYGKNERVSLNFQVQAAKLGDAGVVTGQISKNYDLICSQINASLAKFATAAEDVLGTVQSGLFLTCTALIQREVLDLFRREAALADSHGDEIPKLESQMLAYQDRAIEGLSSITDQALVFRRKCDDMKRMAGALEVTRIMGMVECARQKSVGENLTELLTELEALQDTVSGGLQQIDRLNQRIAYGTESLLSQSRWLLSRAA